MDYIQAILDKRIPIKLLQVTEGENVIFCKSFKEELFNSGFFSTKDKDFVHNYIVENEQKYIVTDVTTPDNKIYRNIKFRVVIDENGNVPYSTFNPQNVVSEKSEYKLPIPVKTEPSKILTESKKEKNINLKEKLEKEKNEQLYLQKAIQLQNNLLQEKTELENERKKLAETQQHAEAERLANEKINAYKQELISEFFETSKKHEDLIKEKFFSASRNMDEKLSQEIESYKIQLNDFLKDLNEKNLTVLKSDLESSEFKKLVEKELNDNLKDYKQFLLEKLEKITSDKLDEFIQSKDNAYFKEKIENVFAEEKTLLEKQKQEVLTEIKSYTLEEINKAADDAKSYARRILDLGGGGGSVAVQYANGGTMNGDLFVNNFYPNNNNGEIGSSLNRWDRIYVNQIDSLSANIVVELSGFYVNGDFTVNGVVSAAGGNSNQWNSVYSNVNVNSSKWESVYSTTNLNSAGWESTESNVNASSASWNSVYTTTNSNSSKWEEIVSVKDYGAVGDGSTDDYNAIQSALAAISGMSKLYFPKGTYIISKELKIGSDSYLYGDGPGVTKIKLSNSATYTQCVLTNSFNTRNYLTNLGNKNIVIKDLEVDGNVQRLLPSYPAPTDGSGTGIAFCNVTNGIIENVYSHDCANHCIDIAASENTITGNPNDYTPGPSNNIFLLNVSASGSGDDCITAHFSRNITIQNAYILGSGGYLVPTNSNGIEIDDGCYDVNIIGGYVTNCIRGLEIKGHDYAPAAKRIHVNGLTCENNIRNFDIRHLGFDAGDSNTAFDIQLLNCTSISPVSSDRYSTLSPRAIRVSNYSNVTITNFANVGVSNTTNLVTFQEGARNVVVNGMSFTSISGSNPGITEAFLKVDSDVLKNVTLKNINFHNCVGLPIYVTGSTPGVVIDGVDAFTTINPNTNFVIDFTYTPEQEPFSIKNVTTTGYLSAYTLGSQNADYYTPSQVGLIENILPANASAPQTVARFGWREGSSQGLNEGVGSKIEFTGSVFSGVSAGYNIPVAFISTEKINATDSDISSNLNFGTASSNAVSAENRMTITPQGRVGINTKSPGETLSVNGTISARETIYALNGNSNNWNNAYTNLTTNSAAYLLSGTEVFLGDIPTLSGTWNSVYTQTNNLSTYWTGNSLLIFSDTFLSNEISNYLVDSDSNAIICYLPKNPSYGTSFTFQDMFNKWNTYNLTISSNDNMIMGKSLFEPLVCDVPGITFTIVFVGGIWGWKVQ